MNKGPVALLIVPTLTALLVSCGANTNQGCVDGKGHDYVHHDAVVHEEEKGTGEYYSCSKCDQLFDADKKDIDAIPTAKATRKILLPYKHSGELVDTISPMVRGYLDCTQDEAAGYLFNNRGVFGETAKPVMLSWKDNGSTKRYTVQLSTSETFETIKHSYTQQSTSISLYNLEPATYFYRIVDGDENYSVTDSFRIDPLRLIKTDTGQVANMRDIGGWPTSTGDKLKYGYLYRSALPSTNDAGLFKELGIKTEIDLRIKGGSADQIGSFTGASSLVNYVIALGEGERYWPQYDMILQDGYKAYTKGYFQKIFGLMADESNYPIDFHCSAGADRTGTLAYIINGLCGVSYEDLTKDFELTSFFKTNRWRSDIKEDETGHFYFTSSGMMDNSDNVHWGKFHNDLMATYGDESGSISKAILSYLTTYCEVPSDTIKTALSIILEGNGYMNLFE